MNAHIYRRQVFGLLAGALVLALAVSGVRMLGWLDGEDPDALVVSADFVDTTGVYVGNEVTYLGVHIGEIVDVEPRGTSMRVVMHLEPGTELPKDAGAQILQGSLVTDRFIELGPAYTGGPKLASGARIEADHTRSPATVDEIAKAIDDLVLALDADLGDGKGGKGLGEALSTTAAALKGNGPHLRSALAESRDALAAINGKDADLTAVTANLLELVTMVGQRDRQLRSFTHAAADTTNMLAAERDELVATLDSLDQLTRLTNQFLKDNGEVLGEDLAGLADVVGVVRENQGSLSEAFDVMPTMAENFARAYDWDRGRLRVQFSFAAGPFSAAFRSHSCAVFAETLGGSAGKELCGVLFDTDGSGLLDPILDRLYNALPGGVV